MWLSWKAGSKMKIPKRSKILSRQVNNDMLILGLDPGTKNFAYSIIKVDDPEYNFLKEDYLELPDVLETGMLKETYEFCKAETMQRDLLIAAVKEITTMAKDKNIDVVGFERWMARPGQVVPGWVERLNYTLGALLHSTKIPIYHVQPSAWKVTIKRRYGIESTKTLFGGKMKTEHEADASLIAVYVHQKYLRITPKKPKKAAK